MWFEGLCLEGEQHQQHILLHLHNLKSEREKRRKKRIKTKLKNKKKYMSATGEVVVTKEEENCAAVSVSSAELAAQSALQEYHNYVRGKILGEALVQSSDVAAAALEKLTQLHARTVEQLNAQIAGLQNELFEAASVIETLGGQIATSAKAPSLVMSPSVARRSFAVGLCSSSREKGSEDCLKRPETGEDPLSAEQQQQRPSLVDETASDAFATAHSGAHDTGETLLEENDVTHSALFAEVLQGRGTLKLHQQQQVSMVTQLKDLTSLLARVVKENAEYRQELQLLRATCVPVEEHLKLMGERDALEQECNFMKVEMQRLEAEMEAALNTVPLDQSQEACSLPLSGLRKEAPELLCALSAPPELPLSPSSPLPPTAMKDATHDSSTKGGVFHLAHSHVGDNSTLESSWNEDEWRHNGLWRTAMRELEQQATLAATQLSAAERLREAEDHIEELQAHNAELRTCLETLEAEDKCVREDCEQLTFRNAVLSQQVTSLLVRVERQRRALEQQEPLTGEGDSISDSEVLLAGEEPSGQSARRVPKKRGGVALAAQSLLERRGSVSALAPFSVAAAAGGVLDVTLQPAGAIEVEGGVRTGLGVFARTSHRPRRSLLLRNLGSPPLETDVTRVPQLPATDQLSGVALGRAPYFASIDCARVTAEGHGGNGSKQHSSSSGGSRNEGCGDKSSGSSTRTPVFSDNSKENRHFLEMLREDENFDAYSINSVAELLQRNQELLQQLYLATQRANVAEERLRQQGKEGSCVTSDTEAAQPRHRVNCKRGRETMDESQSQQEKEGECDTEASSQRKDASDSETTVMSKASVPEGVFPRRRRHRYEQHPQEELDQEMEEREEEKEEENSENSKQLLHMEMDARYIQLQEHVDDHIDAVLRKHEVGLTLADNRLAASLLRILELGQKPDDDPSSGSSFFSNNSQKHGDTTAESVVKESVIASLVRLCTEQGIRATNQAVSLASALESRQAEVIQKCWEEAQRVLRRSAEDLQAAVASLLPAAHHTAEGLMSKSAAEIAEKEGDGGDGNRHDEVQLLQNIASLLRTASLKEHTIQRVLQLAARQQRLFRRINTGRQQKEREGEGEEEEEGEKEKDDDDELDDDQSTLQRLCAQLDGAQARYEKLLADHHEERKQHTLLLDRMWRLEEEKVGAVRSRDEALERMAAMMTREEYEATVDALDTAKASIDDLEAQLRYAHETNGQQRVEIDRWQQVAAEHEQQRAEDVNAAAAQMAQKDRLIAQYVQQNYQLETCNAERLEKISLLEASVTQYRSELEAKDEEVQAVQKRLRHVELALLEQQCTQDLLFSIFPGDRALEENRHLIQAMRSEKERLAEKVAVLQVELDETHRHLDEARLQIHGAEQARQEAELRLQEAALVRATAASAQTPTAAHAAGVEKTMELEVLRRTNASLLVEKRDWMEREALLREQLEALARDPVSENARRYGLKATRSFEEQLAEMQERCVALQERIAATEKLANAAKLLKDEVKDLTTQLTATKDDLVARQKSNESLQEKIKEMEEALQEKAESNDAVRLTLAEKEELINTITGAIRTLEEEAGKTARRLREGEEERQRLYEDNRKLIDTVTALTEEVKKKETERRAAQTALAQGLASAAAASSSHRWRGRSGGPTSITGSLSRTPT